MITESILGRTIQSSGIEDERIVRIDVLSVYLLQALSEAGMFSHMCFKGGNSLRKIILEGCLELRAGLWQTR